MVFRRMRFAAIVIAAVAAACGQSPRLLHPTDPATDFYEVSPGSIAAAGSTRPASAGSRSSA
jgi:hypothetical protein